MTTAAESVELHPLPPQPDDVPWPTLLWPIGEPGGPGGDTAGEIDTDALDRHLAALFDRRQAARLGETHAVVVVHHGRIVAERYAAGVAADSRRISWSTAKSMLNALVGILVGDGRLDLDAPAAVPEWSDPADPRHAITVRQLLEFRPGLAWAEDYVDDTVSDVIEMLFGSGQDDMGAFAAAKPLVHEPGTAFCYSSGTTNILSRIVRDVVGPGNAYAAFARERLFDPIGMHDADLRFDPAGTLVASSYVYATARDYARFATLFLRDGVWDGQRILPAGWVDLSRAPRSVDEDGDRHGAHWWLWDDNPWGAFHAAGYEGQYLIVVPALDLVVVRLGKTVIELRPNLRREITALIAAFAP